MSDLALKLVTREQAVAALAKINQRRQDRRIAVSDAEKCVAEAEILLENRKNYLASEIQAIAQLEAEGRIIMHFLDLLKTKAEA